MYGYGSSGGLGAGGLGIEGFGGLSSFGSDLYGYALMTSSAGSSSPVVSSRSSHRRDRSSHSHTMSNSSRRGSAGSCISQHHSSDTRCSPTLASSRHHGERTSHTHFASGGPYSGLGSGLTLPRSAIATASMNARDIRPERTSRRRSKHRSKNASPTMASRQKSARRKGKEKEKNVKRRPSRRPSVDSAMSTTSGRLRMGTLGSVKEEAPQKTKGKARHLNLLGCFGAS